MTAALSTEATRSRRLSLHVGRIDLGRLSMALLIGGFVLLALFVAAVVPYHDTDALYYGEWSRRIAITGHFHLPGIPSPFYHRPLFYAAQGWLWHWFGFHEWIGRLLSLCFGLLLLWAIVRLAGGRLSQAGLLAGILLIVVPDFARYASAGLTDVPVAALVALCGVLVWQSTERPWGPPTIAAVSLAAVLAKPTALPALAGLAAAVALGPRATLAPRLRRAVVPIAAGIALALVYDGFEASRAHKGLVAFLTAGTGGLYEQVSDQARRSAVLLFEWLGPYLLVPLIFSMIYALARIAGAAHRRVVVVAVPVTAVLAWVLPMIGAPGSGWRVGLFAADRPAGDVGAFLLLGLLALSVRAPRESVPSRLTLARLALWGTPPILAWAIDAPYYSRFLAPAWPALIVLLALVLWTALAGAGATRRVLGFAGVLLLCALAVFDLRNLDSLGARPDGSIDSLRAARRLPDADLLDSHQMRSVADPALGGLVAAVDRSAGARGRILSTDGRSGYFWLGRVTITYPLHCADLRGYRTFALLTERSSIADLSKLKDQTATQRLIASPDGPTNPAYWTHCHNLSVADSVPGAYTVFTVHGGGAATRR